MAAFQGNTLDKWEKNQARQNGIRPLPTLIGPKAKTKNSFISLLCLNGVDYGCEVCGTKDTDVLTRHHKIRQSMMKDNSLSNLVCLCREDHDMVEKFYDWIISFNIPYKLWKQRRELDAVIGRAGSLISILKDPTKPAPTHFAYADLDVSGKFLKDNKVGKIRRLDQIKNESIEQRRSIDKQINNIVLKAINWDNLYIYAVQYVKSKRDKIV